MDYNLHMGLFRSTSIVSAMTMISRIMGFARDTVVATLFGASEAADAFFVAFKIPNFMRRLFAEGSFSQAFVPILSEYRHNKDHAEVRLFLSHVMGSLGMILLLVTAVAVIIAPLLVNIFAPGFDETGERYFLASHMLRITFPYLFFISMTAYMSSVLNTYERFAIPAFTPVLLNIIMIICAYALYSVTRYPIYALAWGVFISGVVQILFQIPFLKAHQLAVKPLFHFNHPGVYRILKMMVPAIVGVSVAQINVLVDTFFASFLSVGSVSWLYYSERLMSFPLGVFAVAASTAVLPHLSRRRALGDLRGFSDSLHWGLKFLCVIGVPASLSLLILAGPFLSVLFQYGKFSSYSVIMARQSLVAFALGVQFFMLIKVFAAGFYAHQDIKTPVRIAIFAMIMNIVFNVALITPLRHAGIALATTLSGILNMGLLWWFACRRGYLHQGQGWLRLGLQLLFANGVIALYWLILNPPLKLWLQADAGWRAWHILLLCVPAIFIYLFCLRLVGFRVLRFLRQVA